ncbi:hypothetical protein NC653_039702 [Populus alba x Populus x berolinensis]|uniref:Uncharacterized protein n=1 Tax=Populus alba x Populus x berolinensis TaxID=444605 RepID=A0AAD6PQV1_9ROSI|nr:hypothetical protein NC653_039702 [Populus alba x Populus x berolinensis]
MLFPSLASCSWHSWSLVSVKARLLPLQKAHLMTARRLIKELLTSFSCWLLQSHISSIDVFSLRPV